MDTFDSIPRWLGSARALDPSARRSKLWTIAAIAVVILFVRIFLGILVEYRWYFPADFDRSAFLSGRRYTFDAPYRAAFYVHILSGPLAIILGSWLMISGNRPTVRSWHRLAGKLQMFVVLALVVPSGLVMAKSAYAGPVAAAGFGLLSLATGVSAAAAVYFAMTRRLQIHQRWATRCFVLLVSPLILRLVSGAVIVLQCESQLSYQLNAWLSWLIPLAAIEVWWRIRPSVGNRLAIPSRPGSTHAEVLP